MSCAVQVSVGFGFLAWAADDGDACLFRPVYGCNMRRQHTSNNGTDARRANADTVYVLWVFSKIKELV